MPDGHSSQADYPGASPYPDYRPSPAPGHSQPSVSADHAGLPAGYGQAAYTGQYPSPTYPGGLTYPGNYPAYPGGYPAMGTVPYPYPYPGGYHRFGMLPLPPEASPLPGASPVEAVKRFFRRYAQFRGYASRSEYWWTQLFLVILVIGGYVALFVPFILSSGNPAAAESDASSSDARLLISMLIFLVVNLALTIPYLALCARRLHDAGQSGWLTLLLFIPYIGPFIIPIVFGLMPSRPDLYRPEWS
ncbi:DUF805 domain-containing protein [Actinomyces capricornis]|uniref:DUF805 domain-containing protein n=1 Tax=Actinomyces capricornis TaxID=2755559 RepID=A0ABN6K7Y9_9ACTO|nr:DUF805 domain-containing protein [Actinomyces capricornis]BDA65428.1 hypothetical protein MANAM107_22620 [Actinomyces capricornis]